MQPPQPQMIDPHTPLTVTLTAAQWSTTIAALRQLPHHAVDDIVVSVQQQLQAGVNNIPPMPPEFMRRTNGAAEPQQIEEPS